MGTTRKLIASLAFVAAMVGTGCSALGIDLGTNHPDGVDFSCVLDDERLSAPLRDPEAAKAWLVKTIRALEEAGHIGSTADTRTITPQTFELIADLRDLAKRARSCLQ